MKLLRMMKLLVATACFIALTSARRTVSSRGRQFRRNDASEPAFWEPQLVNSIDPSQIESRQYYGSTNVGGYGNQGGNGGGTSSYPGQSSSGSTNGSGGTAGSGSAGTGVSENEIPRPIPPNKPNKPIRPQGCLADRGQFPSKRSCAHYLNCWDDVAVEQLCPAGLLFNEKKQYCDFESNVNCGTRPKPTKPAQPEGSRRCPDPNGRYRSSSNCSVFYVCVAGNPIKFDCPLGTVYSEETLICDYPEKVDCKGAATPAPVVPTTEASRPTRPSRPTTNLPSQTTPQESINPNPPYNPEEPELPGPINPYSPPNAFAFRGRPEIWQQRQAVLQSELERDLLQKDSSLEQQDDQEIDSSTIAPWEVFHTIPHEYSKVPCENGEVFRLTDACTSVVVCRNHRPQLINCQPGYAYDKPSDACRSLSTAQC